MIAPIWEQFPEPSLPGYTSILLQFSRDYDPEELIAEIKSLDPRILIFLRKLRHVNLTVFDKRSNIWRSTLRRHDVPFGNDGDNIINLWHNAECSSLKNINFLVEGLLPDPKRPSTTQSEILLAFPIAQDGEPWITSQKVYAFLPVRDYGFKVRAPRIIWIHPWLTVHSFYSKPTFYLLQAVKTSILLRLGTGDCVTQSHKHF